jgi:hypothetical protein
MRKLVGVAVATILSTALLVGAQPAAAALDVAISVNIAPPELPVYEQPEIPDAGYIWTPGYWSWADDGSGYYWVPGTWVLAPEPGYLWTPGWWGFDNGAYLWHGGYWGTEIGFYGGVNYGFGYFGHGYDGGYWDYGQFRYNTAYTRVGSLHITNVYNKVIVNNVTVNHVSFNGGRGGIDARPTEREISAEHAHHLEPVSAQVHQREIAHENPALRLSTNHGHPGIAATQRPGEFTGHGVIAAHGGPPVATQEAHRGPEINRTTEHAPASNTSRAPTPPTVHNTPAPPQQYERASSPHTVTPPPEHVQNTSPPRPEYQRAPEAPRNVEPPHPQSPPVVHNAPPPPQQHEQRPPPSPREGDKREEPR